MTDQPIATHLDCPACGHKGCVTKWESGSTFCHSCDKKTFGDKPMTTPAPTSTVDTSNRVSVPYRKINSTSAEKYKIKTVTDGKGTELYRVYPYPHREKFRKLPKDFNADGLNRGFTNDHFFGMDKFNAGSSKCITVVEGEDDAPSAYQMLGGKYPVIASPGSSLSSELLRNCHDYLNSFEQIVVASDNDAAGEKMATKLAAAFPNKVYRVQLTLHNDANDYLTKGDHHEFKQAWINRTKYVPEFDTSTPDQYVSLLEEEDHSFIPTGIEAYDEKHKGLFQGYVTLFQAPEGTGKTELIHLLEYRLLTEHPDINFATCHLEESKMRTTLGWASYALHKNVTRKDLITDKAEVEDAIRTLTASEPHLFSIGTDEDPMVLIDRIKYYVNVCDCKYVFIEPIQDLAQQYTGPDNTERFLSKIAVQLARIASDLNVGIVMIAHENDDGLVSDCRKLSKQAGVVVRLVREIDHPDPEQRNTVTLRSKKNRPTSFVGYGGQLKFDEDSFTLEEVT